MVTKKKLFISSLFIGLGSMMYSNLIMYYFQQSDWYFRRFKFLVSTFKGINLIVMGSTLIVAYLIFRFERKPTRYFLFSSIYVIIAIVLVFITLETPWLDFLLPTMQSK